jgi:hypothetical protein
MSLSIDVRSIYNPPSSLQYPGVEEESQARAESPPSTSSSHSDLSSPSFNRDSEIELAAKLAETSHAARSDNVSMVHQGLGRGTVGIEESQQPIARHSTLSVPSAQSRLFLDNRMIGWSIGPPKGPKGPKTT